ncbi:hypothetical protein Cgig2_010640 [Carnegiea gigantea]|uniref:Uncharacterized protein n=1 Tax=Carnegiea gigantea TaxID=171969 RepID=A0A9Q1GS70_9CARY|nr:hypothetical protein Cgig2_010640 [Carnegiea gigantea]
MRPPQALSENYHDLCLGFTLSEAEEAACDFRFPKMIQAVFYAMVVNDAFELRVLSRDLAEHLKSSLEGLRLARTKTTLRLKTPDQRTAEGYYEGNSPSASGSHRTSIEVGMTSTTSFTREEESSSSSSCSSASRSKKARGQKEPVHEVIMEGTVYPGASECSNP